MNRKFSRTKSLRLPARCFLTAAGLILLLCGAGWAQSKEAAPAAEASASSKVGIVNIQQAIVTSNEGQRDFGELQKKFDPKRKELESLNTAVQELQKKFSTQGDKLSDEARGDLLKQIDDKKKQLQRSYEDANSDLQSQQNEIANRIGQKMISVLDKYAKEHGYTVVLDVSGQQSPVLWAASSTDLTKALVDAYNASSGVPAPANETGSLPSAPKPTSANRPGTTKPRSHSTGAAH
jgi:outer membrane protein